jgi:hypothetical protein
MTACNNLVGTGEGGAARRQLRAAYWQSKERAIMYRLIVQWPEHITMLTFNNYEAGVVTANWLSKLAGVFLLGIYDTNDERKAQYHKNQQWYPKQT